MNRNLKSEFQNKFLRFKKLIVIALMIVTQQQAVASSTYYYYVKTDDVFSEVLYRSGYTPIYGFQTGFINEIAKFNKIDRIKLDKIYIGQKIYLPELIIKYGLDKEFIQLVPDSTNNSYQVIFKQQKKQQDDLKTTQLVRKVASEKEKNEILLSSFNQFSEMTFGFGTGYSRLDSELDSNLSRAALLSKPHENFFIKWDFFLEPEISFGVDFFKEQVVFSDSNNKVVYNNQIKLISFGLTTSYHWTEFLTTGLRLGMNERLFAPSYQAGTASLESRAIFAYTINLQYKAYEKRKINVTFLTNYTMFNSEDKSTNFNLSSGFAASAGLAVRQNFKTFSAFVESIYEQANLKTSIGSQTEKNLTIYSGVKIPLGVEQK